MASKQITLVDSIQKTSQLRRLLREVDQIENELNGLRIKGEDLNNDLKLSFMLEDMIKSNDLDVKNSDELNSLKEFLKDVQDKSIVLHFSFNQPASDQFLIKLIKWLRQNIDPNVLISVGLNNSIGVGFLLRSTNKYFDFSLGSVLRNKRQLLVQKISEVNSSATS